MTLKSDSSFAQDLQTALSTIRRGGIILYPTDTVWGIGCDSTNADAVKRIYDLKQRSDSKAMIVLVDSVDTIEKYVEKLPEIASQLIDVAIKPLTIIYDHAIGLAPNLIARDGSIGMRVTTEDFSQQLCRRLGRPLVSTSANIAGNPTAQCFAEITPEIINGVDYVVNYRRDDRTPVAPSSIIKLGEGNQVKIIRE